MNTHDKKNVSEVCFPSYILHLQSISNLCRLIECMFIIHNFWLTLSYPSYQQCVYFTLVRSPMSTIPPEPDSMLNVSRSSWDVKGSLLQLDTRLLGGERFIIPDQFKSITIIAGKIKNNIIYVFSRHYCSDLTLNNKATFLI